jgi:hypothetical protein
MEKEKYTGNSEVEKKGVMKECINLVNKVTSKEVYNQIKDLAKRYQIGQTLEEDKLEGIIKGIYKGLKRCLDQVPFYQSILKSYPKISEKDKELKEKGLI